MKGQKARSGGGPRLGFQGGGLALIKSLPMLRGFTNNFRQEYTVVNVDTLASFPANSEITPDALAEAGTIKNVKQPVKVLGRGNLSVPLVVQAHKFSRSAREKIEAAGGSAREIA
jgi:large subunit ribosomal protein L15